MGAFSLRAVQVLVNIIDLGMGLQQAIDAPRYRYMSGRNVWLEDEIPATVARKTECPANRPGPPEGFTSRRTAIIDG
ncbi:MAG TPA: hypothetical protein VEW46_25815 [Pyrinomonadaceae bacterium]|nr:hypothetical protein [Pyrinomonadaceae bacterium]